MQECKIYENKLPELRALTERLTFGGISSPQAPNYTQIDTERGHAYAIGLSSSPDYSVVFVYTAADTPSPAHQHAEWEFVIVIDGHLELFIEGDTEPTVILQRFGFHAIPPNTQHSSYSSTQTTCLAVTVPADKELPSPEI